MSEVKMKEDGLLIPLKLLKDFPPNTNFHVRIKGSQIILSSGNLTEKTRGIVKPMDVNMDKEYEEMILGRE